MLQMKIRLLRVPKWFILYVANTHTNVGSAGIFSDKSMFFGVLFVYVFFLFSNSLISNPSFSGFAGLNEVCMRRNMKAMLKLSLFVTFVLLLALPCESSVYYVAVNGSDTNTGTDYTSPWLRCPGMIGWTGDAKLEPGDTVFFRNTDTWEAHEGQSMVQVVGGVTYDGQSWGDGDRAVLRASGALNRAVINIMEDDEIYPTVIRGFVVDANDFVTSGITINWPHADRDLTGATKRVENCLVRNVWSESALNQYEYGILMGGWGGFHIANIEVLNCLVHDISRGGICNYMGNDKPDNRSDNVLIRGNEIYAAGKDPRYGGSSLAIKNHTVNTTVEFNYIHDAVNGTGIGLSVHPSDGFRGPEEVIIRHNIVSNIPHCGMYLGSPGDKSFDVYGNIFMHCRYEAIRVSNQMSGSVRAGFYNNTFYKNYPGDWSQQFRVEKNSAHFEKLEVKNNIFYCPSGSSSRALLDDDEDITAHANNLYFHPDKTTLVISNGNRFTAESISQWEPTAFAGEPGFKDTSLIPAGFVGEYGYDLMPYPDGLSLTARGDALDNGADLGEKYSGAVNLSGKNISDTRPFGNCWDIGAYESYVSTEVHKTFGLPQAKGLRCGKQKIGNVTLYTVNGRVCSRGDIDRYIAGGIAAGQGKVLRFGSGANLLIVNKR